MSKIQIENNAGGIEGLKVISTPVYGDERGYFTETYNCDNFAKLGIDSEFVQDNQSCSSYGVLRGLHMQKSYSQAKLVRVISGRVFDVAVDMRKDSPTYLKHFGIELSGDNHKQFFIPKHFAHGFLVLSQTAVFSYKVDDYFHPEDEFGIRYDDPTISVQWPIEEGMQVILSQKDLNWGYVDA